jgi:Glyoxalase-like domain
MTVDAPKSGSGLQMVIVRAAEPVKVGGGFCPNLFTDHHDEETERLTGLGAKVVNEVYLESADHPTIRMTVLADPEGKPVNLATLQSE